MRFAPGRFPGQQKAAIDRTRVQACAAMGARDAAWFEHHAAIGRRCCPLVEIGAAFDHLRQVVEEPVAAALESAVRTSSDVALNRLNPLAFARSHGLDTAKTVAGFLHATQAGVFDLSWNVVCPVCGGVLSSRTSLKQLRRDRYDCAFCLVECQPVLDDSVEVTFTINRRVRQIGGHDPERLPLRAYLRQAFFGSGLDLPDDLAPLLDGAVLDALEVPPAARADREVRMVPGQSIVFDPVGHVSQRIDVVGDETAEPQSLTIVLEGRHTALPAATLRPGPLRLTIVNRSGGRALPDPVDRRTGPVRSRRTPRAVPHRQATPLPADVQGPVPHRSPRRRPGDDDPQPRLPLHRYPRLDGALRHRRRSRRLR